MKVSIGELKQLVHRALKKYNYTDIDTTRLLAKKAFEYAAGII